MGEALAVEDVGRCRAEGGMGSGGHQKQGKEDVMVSSVPPMPALVVLR